MTEYVFPVGKIVGFHGLRGDVKVRPETNNPSLLLDINDAEIVLKDKREKLTIAEIRLEKRILLVKFSGYHDRTSVEHFLNAPVFTTRDQLLELEEDEWWVDDLVGMSVHTKEGKDVGTISGIVGTAGELLEVKTSEGGSILVPFVKALVPVVDMKNRRIEVVDLPGLLEST